MEITYIAHSCFKIKGQNLTIITDPYDDSIGYKVQKLKGDLLLISHSHSDHDNTDSVSDVRMTLTSPGEYEIAGVSIVALPTFHDDKMGADRGKNVIYHISIDGFSILHLGDLGHELSKDTLERLPEVDILMVPVGGVYTIDPDTAAKVISSIEPSIVIPMHYQTQDLKLTPELSALPKFLNAMGVDNPKTLETLKINKRNEIPEDTEIVVLKYTA